MKNVDERKRASGDLLWCPYSGGDDDSAANCTTILCAHYNPDARECVHVEAARAQVRIADVLEAIEMLRLRPCVRQMSMQPWQEPSSVSCWTITGPKKQNLKPKYCPCSHNNRRLNGLKWRENWSVRCAA